MATLTLRNVKGSALTFTELDANFSNLNTDKAEKFANNGVSTTYAGPYTFVHGTPASGRHEFLAASTGGWEAYAHTLQVQFDFVTSAYFSLVDAGGTNHFAVVLHQDPALVGTDVLGNGVIFGNCNNGVGERTPYVYPSAMVESWFNNTAATNENSLFRGSEIAPDYKLTDSVTYRVIVQSSVDHNSQKWVRYQLYRKNTGVHSEGAWDLIKDTGHLLDFNSWANFSKTGVYFGQVFSPGAGWQIDISNVIISWGPFQGIAPGERLHRRATTSGGIFPTYSASPITEDYAFNMTGWGNTQIKDFAKSPWDWDTVLDVNDIKNSLIAAGMSSTNATAIETYVGRPLYCLVANILYHMKQRGW